MWGICCGSEKFCIEKRACCRYSNHYDVEMLQILTFDFTPCKGVKFVVNPQENLYISIIHLTHVDFAMEAPQICCEIRRGKVLQCVTLPTEYSYQRSVMKQKMQVPIKWPANRDLKNVILLENCIHVHISKNN